MRAILALLLLAVTANAVPPAGDYVVVLNDQESPRMVARDHGIGPKKMWTNALHGFHATLTTNHLAKLERDTRVQIVETNLPVQALAQTLPYGVRRIGCTNNALWLASSTVPINCDVAVIDTGIDYTHADLYVYAHTNFTADADQDGYGHGTHCAGIVGALNNGFGVVGVAPGVRLWSVKVLDNTGSGSLSTIISGVDYVTAHSSEIEVANMSLGGQGSSDSLRLAIQNSVAKGVVYVVAAGNSGFEVYGGDDILGTYDDYFPACYPEVMTVSAMTDTDGFPGGLGSSVVVSGYTCYDDCMAPFSNYSKTADSTNPVNSPGGAIDVAAPGVNVYSTYKGGTYAYMSGTSMACPHVAGSVALYIAQYGRATTAAGVYAIRQALINAAPPDSYWDVNPSRLNPNDLKREGLVDVAHFGAVPSYPSVTLAAPNNGSHYLTTDTIWFVGSATDPLDGDLTAGMGWSSSIDGALGAGGALTHLLTAGTHTITAAATNSGGLVARSKVSVVVSAPGAPTPPTVTITAPATGSTYADTDPIAFTGTATDAVDGTITSKLSWSSSISGIIGKGGAFTISLPAGIHTITATVTNTAGLSGVAKIGLTITGTPPPPPPTNYPPTVTITQPANGQSFPQGATVVVAGSANDTEDGDLSAAIVWNDSVSGSLGTGASRSYVPAIGTHVITASVQDSDGATASTSRTITVVAPSSPLSAAVTANPSVVVNKQKVLLTATVTAGGSAVVGAAVNFSIRGANGKVITKTGLLTGSAGTASYYQQVMRNQLGAGVATVTVNASKTGNTPAQATTTFTVR